MAGENEMKIIFSADTAPLNNEVDKSADKIEKFGDTVKKAAADANKGFDAINRSIKGLPEAFDKVASGSIVLTKIAGNLEGAGQAAVESSKQFKALEGAPLQTIQKLDDAIKIVKATLANGFKANIDTSGLSPQVFSNVSKQVDGLQSEVVQLALQLNEAAIAAQNLGSSFDKGFQSGLTEELQRAGISVAEFKDALASITGTAGANLTPLLTALDSIQAESAGTTNAIKSIGGALQGVSVLAKAPINDLVHLDEELKVIKATLASGFKPAIEKINISPADFSAVKGAVDNTSASVQVLDNLVRKTAADFGQIKNAASGIAPQINDVTGAASKGANALSNFGRKPLDDIKDLDKQIRTIKNTFASGFKPAISKINLSQPTNSVHTFAEQIRIAQKYLDQLNATSVKTGSAVTGLGRSMGGVKKSSNEAALALNDVGRVAQDLPFGFMGIANNLNPMLESFRRLRAESGSTGGAIKALATSLTGAGGIGLALSAVTAAILIYQNGIGGFNRKTEEAKKATDEYRDTVKSAVASVAQEAARVTELVGVIQNEVSSKKDRVAAIKELNKISPEFFGKLTDEKKLIDGLSGAYNAYIQNLTRAAQSKIWEKKLEQLLEKKINLNLEIDPDDPKNIIQTSKTTGGAAADEFAKAYKLAGILKDSVTKSDVSKAGQLWDQYGNFLGEETKKGFIRANPFFDGAAIRKQAGQIDNEIEFVQKKLGELGNIHIDPFKPSGEKEDKKIKELKDQLDGLRKKLEVINKLREAGALPKFKEDDAEQIAKDILKVLNEIDAREVEIKIKPKLEIDPQLNELEIDKIEAEANKKLAFTKMQAPLSLVIDTKSAAITPLQASANEALKRAGLTEYKIPSVEIGEITVPAGGLQIAGGFDKIAKSAQEKLKALLEAKQESLHLNIAASSVGVSDSQFQEVVSEFQRLGFSAADAFNKATAQFMGQNIGKILADGVDAAFTNIGSAIAEVFNGGGLAAAAEGFLDIIGSVLQEVGKQIIIASTLVKALKESLKALFATPEVPLGIGIALVALGGILKNIKLDKPRKFADGGLVLGPTVAQIGEAGPEMIVPLNRANQFLDNAGNSPSFPDKFRVEGTDLVLVLNRALGSQNKLR